MSQISLVNSLRLSPADAVDGIVGALRQSLAQTLRRKGYLVAMSGGIDSSLCAALAVRAVGAEHVFGLMLPERESDPASLTLATMLAEQLGVQHLVEDIAPTLDALRCYSRRNDAIRRIVPEFGDDWGCKLVISKSQQASALNVTYLSVQPPDGESRQFRLGATEYREIVAASNFKQRTRKMFEYYHADRLHYAVMGTPNRLEYDQGFFVKGGDGLADVKPIAHLYKTQVYQLAEFLEIPQEIRMRTPTTDTFSIPQTQEEYFYALPMRTLDLIMFAHDDGRRPESVSAELDLSIEAVRAAYRDIEQKRLTTAPLHVTGLLMVPTYVDTEGLR